MIAAILAAHAIFLLAPPLALTDVFNYINYGRMEVVHHLNPYTTIPILEPHSDPSFALSNWHELLSPYGPLFTLLTFARRAARRGRLVLGDQGDPGARQPRHDLRSCGAARSSWAATRCAAMVLVGLNPIVLVWGLGGDHNDFLMVFFIDAGYLPAAAGGREREQRTRAAGGLARGGSGRGCCRSAPSGARRRAPRWRPRRR